MLEVKLYREADNILKSWLVGIGEGGSLLKQQLSDGRPYFEVTSPFHSWKTTTNNSFILNVMHLPTK